MPAWRVLVMPVSGAQHASVQEMLHAAVHSMYSRDGSVPGIQRSDGRGFVLLQRQLQRAIAAEFRAAGVQIRAQRGDRRARPDGVTRRTCARRRARDGRKDPRSRIPAAHRRA